MGETAHNPAPVLVAAPPPSSLAFSKGPSWSPSEILQNLEYCIHSNPSWPETFLLAFQHYIVMLGTTILITRTLVTQMGGDPADAARVIQTLVFMSGINTLLQTFIGTRLPTVMGPSYAFVLPVLSIIRDYNDETFSKEHDRFEAIMRTIQGSMIVSSFINIILGYSKGWKLGRFSLLYCFLIFSLLCFNVPRLLSPITIVPVVCVVGLGLFMRGFPLLANCVELGLPMLILLVICQNLHSSARPVLERYGLLFCGGIIWAFAAILTVAGAYNNVGYRTKQSCRTDRSYLISSSPWVRVPYPFQWGAPIFRASHVFGMIGATLVSAAESTGAFYGAARLAGATSPPAHVLSRSIGLQGVGLLLDGIFGAAVGSTASVENVGLLGHTHIGSRRVVQVSTGFMFFFSIFGKFGGLFASIPLAIFAAAYCVLYGIVAAIGISFIQFSNTNSMRNHYVLGLALFLAISIPQYFVSNTTGDGHGPIRADGGWFNDILNTVFSSPPAVAMIVGATSNDRGIPWWKPFQNRKGDSRSAEFYGMPIRINEWMPTRYL
ncbi:PIGMENT DEFECTIVE EMBRYO family protein [Salix suchowensis]|nr:PIGMENT DEFECTIVE EMBRYO family protein [Salix suchowensis]